MSLRRGDPVPRRFRDGQVAGRVLASLLRHHAGDPRVLVLALPRGGVPVGSEIAKALGAPLDVFVVRKLGVPGHEELAIGAIASGRVLVLNDDVVQALRITREVIDAVAAQEGRELERRERAYRGDRLPVDPAGKVVIVVDDGLATGATMRAAVRALRDRGAERLVVAVPTAAPQTCDDLRHEVDEIVCAMTPEPFDAVGLWYEDFSQTTDGEVQEILERATRHQGDDSA
jgi:predicted phosphoribosyltransferase